MKKIICPSASCLQLVALFMLTLCLCNSAGANDEALPSGKVPDALLWHSDDGGAYDQEEFGGVIIHSVFQGSESEPKIVMFYPSIGNDKIDTAVEKLIFSHVDDFNASMKKEKTEATDISDVDFSKYIISSNYKVTFPTSKTVVIEFEFGIKLGGRSFRHPQNLVFSIDSGERLEIKKLFAKPELALKILSEWSRATLPQKLSIVNRRDIASGTEPNEANFSNYRVAPNGLFIQFGRYQVGPGAVGDPEIFIPLKKLESAGPSPSVWDRPDLRKIALSISLQTPAPDFVRVKKEHATFQVPISDKITLPCSAGSDYNEQCIFILPMFTLHTDPTSQEFAFVEGAISYGGNVVLGCLWGIYETESGFKSTNPLLLGEKFGYQSVSMKENTIMFGGVKAAQISQDRINRKYTMVNGVLKKAN